LSLGSATSVIGDGLSLLLVALLLLSLLSESIAGVSGGGEVGESVCTAWNGNKASQVLMPSCSESGEMYFGSVMAHPLWMKVSAGAVLQTCSLVPARSFVDLFCGEPKRAVV
jgi:hypothetical protein